MGHERTISLRAGLAAIFVVLGVLTLGAAVCLMVIAGYLHRITGGLEENLESMRIAYELTSTLRTYRETSDEVTRAELEADVRRLLPEARQHIGSHAERALIEDVERTVEAYLATQRDRHAADEAPLPATPEARAMFTALRSLVRLDAEEGRLVRYQASQWDRIGSTIGFGVAVVVVATGLALIWLLRHAFRPVLTLRAAMQRFGEGDRSSRAPERGMKELREIAAQFNRMADTLEEQRKHQLAFLGGVAHDLRNPLTVLKMSCAMISPEQPLPAEERVRHIFARVQRQIDRLERMAWDLLDASRIQAGTLELRIEEHDARDIARSTLDLFEPASPRHEIALALPEHPVPVRCDPDRMGQVMNNLVSNAIKYSPLGGKVGISVSAAGREALISVSDPGIGMSAQEIRHIFEPFRRAGASPESIPGVGLGLFVAQRIVDAHGGRIDVESEREKGSTFRIYLPLAAARA